MEQEEATSRAKIVYDGWFEDIDTLYQQTQAVQRIRELGTESVEQLCSLTRSLLGDDIAARFPAMLPSIGIVVVDSLGRSFLPAESFCERILYLANCSNDEVRQRVKEFIKRNIE